jgi:hypothetical protein
MTGTERMAAVAGVVTLIALCVLAPARAGAAPADSGFRPQTALDAQGLGSGKVYSLDIDHRFTRGTALRAGVGTWAVESGLYVLPLAASALIGEGDLCLELSAGPMFVLGGDASDFGSNVIVTTFGGIRYEPRKGGLFLRTGIGPLFGGGEWEFWPTFSAGYAF